MMIFYSVFHLAFCQIGFSQTDSLDLKKFLEANFPELAAEPEGYFYKIDRAGQGALPKEGDYVQLRFAAQLLDGTVVEASLPDEPMVFSLGQGQVIDGLDLALRHFPAGSQGRIWLPAKLAYGTEAGWDKVPPGAPVLYIIELQKIMNAAAYQQWLEGADAQAIKQYTTRQQQQAQTDQRIIKNYAGDHQLQFKQTPSGLHYLITTPGKGTAAQQGDIVSIHYEGYLPDDSLFDSTKPRNKPYHFVLGRGQVIKGLEEGIKYFNKGSEGWLMIPSGLAYGPEPIEQDPVYLPANAVLLFKITVVDISTPVKRQVD